MRLRRDFGQLIRGIKAHALLHREHRPRSTYGSIVATIEEDYAALRKLLADLLATASEVRMRKAVKATIEVVDELKASAGTDGVTVRAVADKLKLDMSATYRRLQAAEQAGLIVNQEDRPRRPGRYKITGDKEPGDMWLLPKVEELRAAYDDEQERRKASSSPRSPAEHRKKLHIDRISLIYRQ